VNGTLVSTFSPLTRPGDLTNNASFVIARNLITPSHIFVGALDELELFNRVLSPAEIQAIFIAGSHGKCKDTRRIATLGVFRSKNVVGQGFSLDINVTVQNLGTSTENFNVTVSANTTAIQTRAINLTGGNTTTITFKWNTTGFAKGNYTISAYAWPVPGEIETGDNTYVDGWVIVAMVGDVTGPAGLPDGKVDIRDIAAIAKLFGKKCDDPEYVANYDINDDCKLDIKDVANAARRFGQVDP